jgi:hypothetical protein
MHTSFVFDSQLESKNVNAIDLKGPLRILSSGDKRKHVYSSDIRKISVDAYLVRSN